MDRDAVFDESPFIKSNIIKDERFKAWLVAEGYLEGTDFHEIFSPIVKLVSIHVVLALVMLLDLELVQLDVKTVLHGVFWKRGCIWNNQKG